MFLSKELLKLLKNNNINYFVGVPDSILKNFSIDIEKKKNHIISTNEGSAIGFAAGYYLSKKKLCCVYLQNSGLGNAINPLSSITHSKVYSIPMLLMIGWRGSPNSKDEPQHLVKGNITRELLSLLKIKYCILRNKKDFLKLKKLIKFSQEKKVPVACLIEKGVIKKSESTNTKYKKRNKFLRKDVIEHLLSKIKRQTRIISTTGYTSRELNQIRLLNKNKKGKDFYMVGGMGHTSSLALGYSLFKNYETLCLDGDGSLLMHMGALGTVGKFAKKNFKHILFNNNSHESVGGQKTISDNVNFEKLTKALGYKKYFMCKSLNSMKKKMNIFLKGKGPSFFEIQIDNGSMKNLGRPKNLLEIKEKFLS